MYKSNELIHVLHDEIVSSLDACGCGEASAACARGVVLRLCEKLHGPWALYFPTSERAREILGIETRNDTIRTLHRNGGLSGTDLAKRYGLSERQVRRIIFTDE